MKIKIESIDCFGLLGFEGQDEYYEIRRNNPNLKTFSICLGPSPIINILTSGLPGNVTRPIYLEYNSRKRKLNQIWANPENNYHMLQNNVSIIQALLAISIFYRHVMEHIHSAVSFYKSVKRKSVVWRTNAQSKSGKWYLILSNKALSFLQ